MQRKGGTVLKILGALLLLAALSLLVYNRWESRRAEDAADGVLGILQEESGYHPDYSGILRMNVPEDGIMPTVTIDGYEYIGMLTIPRFGLELPVMSEWSYDGMRIAPGRFSGSVWTDDLIICGHNYERHFGMLKDLEPGDSVIFTDVLENEFQYEVSFVEILQPTAIEEMTAGNWDLTLFTCTYGGQARVTVRCNYTKEWKDRTEWVR